MNRINLVVFLTFIINTTILSQTNEERKKIIEDYNFTNINMLKSHLSIYNSQKETRIENYLKSSLGKRTYKNNGQSYLLFDIINGLPVYMTAYNLNSAKATNTVELQPGGTLGLNLEGTNMIIGAWDIDHPLGTHSEFLDDQAGPQTRVTYADLISPVLLKISDHATHVSGTLIGKGTNTLAKGMAPKASLRAFTAVNDDQEATNEAANGLLLSNHSYGVPIFTESGTQQVPAQDIGAYTLSAQLWDQIAFNAPYFLAVMSAGNEGGTSKSYAGALATGYDKLTYNKTAKNILVVASAVPIISSGKLTNFLSSQFSSEGPTDDFRIKPDITGDGNEVFSSFSSSINDYGTLYGTSMSSPNVSGSLLLLQEYYNQLNSNYMRSATLKAVACHTAKDDVAKIGPDPVFGWGFLDTEASALTIKNAFDGFAVINELTLVNNQTFTYQFSATSNDAIKATICWTDPAGPVQSNSLNSTTTRLVNDLDLRIEDSNSTVYTPWKLDSSNAAAAAIKGDNSADNIERIDINSPISGNYTLTVTHKNSLTNGSQPFSLILTGSNLTLNTQKNILTAFKVWPNPVTDKLNFKINQDNTIISLYDLQGRQVYFKKLNTVSSEINYSINTKTYKPGIYFLTIKSRNLISNYKIIKK